MDFQLKLDITPTLDAGKINAILSTLKNALGPLGDEIHLVDEKELNAALGQIREAAEELDNVGEKAKSTEDKTMKLAGAFFKFNQVREGLQTLTDTMDQLSKPFVALDTATAQLRTLGAEAAQMAPSLREAAIVMSEELPFAAAELQQTMFDALASGVQGGEEGLKKFADTAAKLAVGGGSSIGEATTLLAGQLNAYGQSAEQAGRFSDVFFNTVNFGVTSIGELSGQLSNVVPTAASLGIEIEGVGAALAQMTQKGVPTAQSTTKLNQLMLELAKPSAALAPILKEAGVSLESLKQDDLPVTLAKVKSALEATGKASVQAFSSSEAAAAFNVLTGDLQGFQKTFEDVRDTTGSAENAYLQMSDSIEVQNRRIQASFEAALIRGFDALGGGITGIVSASSSLAPTITTLIGLKQIFPADLAKNAAQFGLSILSKVIPSLVTQTVTTAGATTSQLALNTAMLANPVFLGIAGLIAAAGIAYAVFGNSTKDLGDATKDANEALTEFQKSTAQADAVAKQGEKVTELAQKYESLKGSTTTKGQEEFKKATEDLAKAVPDAVVAIDQFNEAGAKTGTTYEVNTQQLREFVAEQNRIAQEQKNEALANLDDQTKALADSYNEAIAKQQELRDDRKDLQGLMDQGLGDAKSLETFGNPFESVGDDLKDINAELAEQQKKLQAARPALEKQVAGYREMGLSAEQIAQRTGLTTAQVIEFGGEIKGSAVNAKELESAIAGMSQTQQQAVRLVADQANGYQAAQSKVDELNAKIASQKAVGADTSQLEKDLAEAQKIAGEKKLKLEATIQAQGGDKMFEGLDENAKKGLSGLKSAVSESLAEIEAKAAQSKLGDALSQAATLKADLDANDRIGALMEKFRSAKTQAEKDSIAATIAAQVPSAISGYDKLTGAVQVSEEKVQEFVAAQKQSFGGEIEQRRKAFEDGLKSQANTLAQNRDRMGELQRAIVEGTSKGQDVSKLRGEYATLQKTVDDGTQAISRTVKEGQRVGLVKGDVKDLGTEFKLSAGQANTITTAVRQAEQATKDTKTAAGDLAAQFDAVAKAANEAKEASKKQLAQLILDRREGKITDAEFKQRSKDIVATGKDAVKTGQQVKSASEESARMIGDVTTSSSRASAGAGKAAKSAFEIAKALFDVRSKELEADEQTTINLQEQNRIRAGREADDRDALATEQEKLRTIVQQVRQYATLFKIQGVDQTTPIDELIGDPTKLDGVVRALDEVQDRLSTLKPPDISKSLKPLQGATEKLFVGVGAAGSKEIADRLSGAFEKLSDPKNGKLVKQEIGELLKDAVDPASLGAFQKQFGDLLAKAAKDPKKFEELKANFGQILAGITAEGFRTPKNLEAVGSSLSGLFASVTPAKGKELAEKLQAIFATIGQPGTGDNLKEALQTALAGTVSDASLADFSKNLGTALSKSVKNPQQLATLQTTLTELLAEATANPDTAAVGIGMKLKSPEERGGLSDLTAGLQNDIITAQNSIGELTIKAKPVISTDALRDLERDQLKADVAVGIKPEGDLVAFLNEDLQKIKDELETVRAQEVEEVRKAYTGHADLEEKLAQVKGGNTEKQAKLLRQIFEMEQTAAEKLRAKRQEDFEKQQKNDQRTFDRTQQRLKETNDQFASFFTSALQGRVESKTSAALKALEEQHEAELVSDEEFERQKEEVQKNAENRKLMIQSAGIGARRAAERQAEIASLENQRKAIEDRQNMLLELGVSRESKPFKDLQDEIDGLTADLEEKKDVVGALTGEIGDTIINVFSGLMDGQEDAIKRPFRQLFGVIVGALQKLASAKIVEVIINSFGPGGIPGLLLALGGKPFIEGVVNALLSPITASLLSFSTGGRVDEPTLALIGDASRSRPGPDTEWVMRDRDIKTIINATVRSIKVEKSNTGGRQEPRVQDSPVIAGLMAEMVQEMRSFSGRIHVLERDIGQASTRYGARVKSRILNPRS